jgi:hypothetical protein
MPVLMPVNRTASQKLVAPGDRSVEGISAGLGVDGCGVAKVHYTVVSGKTVFEEKRKVAHALLRAVSRLISTHRLR